MESPGLTALIPFSQWWVTPNPPSRATVNRTHSHSHSHSHSRTGLCIRCFVESLGR